jgi:membrane protein YqaA with SNARE-associated domain
MFERLTRFTKNWIDSRWMMPSLGVASFLESIVIPIPLEAILIPLMQKRRERVWWLAGVALLGCVIGAAVGYAVGWGFMETGGQWLIERMGWQEQLDAAQQRMAADGFLFILTVSVVPIPFQIAMIAAGATGYPVGLYLLATLISRGFRYFGLALLVLWLGDRAEAWYEKHRWQAVALLVLLVAAAWGSQVIFDF